MTLLTAEDENLDIMLSFNDKQISEILRICNEFSEDTFSFEKLEAKLRKELKLPKRKVEAASWFVHFLYDIKSQEETLDIKADSYLTNIRKKSLLVKFSKLVKRFQNEKILKVINGFHSILELERFGMPVIVGMSLQTDYRILKTDSRIKVVPSIVCKIHLRKGDIEDTTTDEILCQFSPKVLSFMIRDLTKFEKEFNTESADVNRSLNPV